MTMVNLIGYQENVLKNDIDSDVIFLHFEWSGELLFTAIFSVVCR